MAGESGDDVTGSRKRRRDPERVAQAAETFAAAAAPTPVAGGPPAVAIEDGASPTRRARYLRRVAANRSRKAMGKAALPDIRPGSCEPCSGWGVLGQAGLRCQLCMGEGD